MPEALQFSNKVIVPLRPQPTEESDGNFVPVCFSRMPNEALSGLPLYMRNLDPHGRESFTLYAAAGVKFTPGQRQRLHDLGISFVHIQAEDQPKLRRQLEAQIEALVDDQSIELSTRCEIIYETAVELIDETFMTRELGTAVPRLMHVARSIVRLNEESRSAFEHFFAAARHDACLSTHAANAATWIVPLAMAMGEEMTSKLTALCMGAMLYDVGMAYLPASILNQGRKLNAGERQRVQQHPEMGAQYLRQLPQIDPLVPLMAIQHQERLDGSGYPRKLTFDRIHLASRMTAVLDTFDALTSFRPFRRQGHSPASAMAILTEETPHHYDPQVVEEWGRLLRETFPGLMDEQPADTGVDGGAGRRRFERYATNCPAVLRILTLKSGIWTKEAEFKAVAHNLSRGGMGLLSRVALNPGDYFRARLQAKDGVPRVLTGVVVRVRATANGTFDIGARFVDLDQEAAPLPLGDFMPPSSEVEFAAGGMG